MLIGIPREIREGESRVSVTPEAASKLISRGFKILAERDCGKLSGFPDTDYPRDGIEWTDAKSAFAADIVLKINRPTVEEVDFLKPGATLITQIEPFTKDSLLSRLAEAKITTIGLEYIPRIARTQNMDVLSSQANITGYRSVIEAANQFGRFFPLMMTAAGSAKSARVMILGVGVAGLQAIATAKRLGAIVEAYDVRPEVKEQIESLGAKPVELDIGENASGDGGYAKELSESAKSKQQQMLNEKLLECDVIITTANIPGKKAPVLVTEDIVKGMRAGSIIIDLAAATGGNCPLTEADKIVKKHEVTIVGYTNYPALMPADASNFYSNNVINVLNLLCKDIEEKLSLDFDLNDDVVASMLVTHNGELLKK